MHGGREIEAFAEVIQSREGTDRVGVGDCLSVGFRTGPKFTWSARRAPLPRQRKRHPRLRLRRRLPHATAGTADPGRGHLSSRSGRRRSLRLVVKLALRYAGGRATAWLFGRLWPWLELFMMQRQLGTLKQLAEAQAR